MQAPAPHLGPQDPSGTCSRGRVASVAGIPKGTVACTEKTDNWNEVPPRLSQIE